MSKSENNIGPYSKLSLKRSTYRLFVVCAPRFFICFFVPICVVRLLACSRAFRNRKKNVLSNNDDMIGHWSCTFVARFLAERRWWYCHLVQCPENGGKIIEIDTDIEGMSATSAPPDTYNWSDIPFLESHNQSTMFNEIKLIAIGIVNYNWNCQMWNNWSKVELCE